MDLPVLPDAPLRPALCGLAVGFPLGGLFWAAGLIDPLGVLGVGLAAGLGGIAAALGGPSRPSADAPAPIDAPVCPERPAPAALPQAGPGTHPAVEATCATLTDLEPFFSIADLQLRSLVEQTEGAASAILGELRALDDALGDAAGFVGATRARMTDLVEKGDEAYAALARTLRAYLAARLEETQAEREHLTAISGQIRNLDTVTGVLDQLGQATNMLALNASIEAARSGEAGLGFTVVARELRALAQRSRTATGEASQMIEAIRGSIETDLLAARTQERVLAEQGQIQRLLAQVDTLSQAFAVVGAAPRELGELDERNRLIGSQILQVFGRVQFQDVVRQQIEALCGALRLLHGILEGQRDQLGGLAVDPALTPAQLLAQLRASYVTAIQHTNHSHATGGRNEGAALADIELF